MGARGQVELGPSEVDDAAVLDADEVAALVAEVIAALVEAPEVARTGFEFETTADALLGCTLEPVLDSAVVAA